MLSKPSTLSPKQTARDSNIELLRIFAILGVIILHYNNETIGGGLRYAAGGSFNRMALYAIESLCICAVNVFILITGYFSCTSTRADLKKAAALLIQVSLFRTATYLFSLMQGVSFSISELFVSLLPVNWFVMLYVGMYLLSPYINLLLSRLSAKGLRALLILSFVLFSLWPTLVYGLEEHHGFFLTGLNTIALAGGDRGYTLIQFLLIYLIGAYIRLSNLKIKLCYSIPLLLASFLLLTLESSQSTATAWAYCNPLVITEAVALFAIFRKLRFKSSVINTLAKSAFTCYLAHIFFLKHYRIEYAVNASPLYMLCHIVFAAISVYLFCFITYVVYSLIAKPVSMLFRRFTVDIRADAS